MGSPTFSFGAVLNQINDPANTYDFGLDFNYAQWPVDTQVTLTNVPWNNDYRDVVRFNNRAALNAYIDASVSANVVMERLSYVKPNMPIRIPVPFNSAYRFNYLRVSNPVQPVGGDIRKDYYYFITDVRYVAPNTTEIVVQLDVWQTFVYDVTFGNCYVERGHIGVANEDQDATSGRVWLTVPEGLETGSDPVVFNREVQSLISNSSYGVLVTSTTSLTANPGSPVGTPTTFSNYRAPQVVTGTGSQIDSIGLAVSSAYIPKENVTSYFNGMSRYPWITQGIIKAIVVPDSLNSAAITSQENQHAQGGTNYPPTASGSNTALIRSVVGAVSNGVPFPSVSDKQMVVQNFRNQMINRLPERYRHLRKFCTYPYFFIQLTSYSGSSVVLRPENVLSDDLTVVTETTMIPGSERMQSRVLSYNSRLRDDDENSELYDVGMVTANFPTLPVNNNNAGMLTAQSALSIAGERSTADWSQQKAIAANNASYDVQGTQINAMRDQAALQRSVNSQNTSLANDTARKQWGADAITGIVTSAGSGAAVGGAAGLAGGAAMGAVGAASSYMSMGIQADSRNASLAIQNNASRTQQNISQAASSHIRDTNYDLAAFAAKGDYANTIGAINARVQEMASTQPSLSAQIGGDYHRFLHGGLNLAAVFKSVDLGVINRIGEYWLRYGYAVQRFSTIPQNLHCMSKFTYWKLSETYISAANMTEQHKQTIRGIMEKGVTVWRSPNDIGNVDIADNVPVSGITIGY